jgi:GTPase SAR1 family protein
MEEPRKRIFKIILVGGQGVGKSSLINRYIDGTFKDEYFATIGIDFKLHNVTVG